MPENKLRISIKFGDIEATYKIAENRASEIYTKIKNIIDPANSSEESEIEI